LAKSYFYDARARVDEGDGTLFESLAVVFLFV
jgi:hypothetical protein